MYPKLRELVAHFGVGLATLVGGLGLLISFVPGAEAWWFGAAAGLAALGLLSPRWQVRLIAAGLVAVCTCSAWLGYQHGLRYQEWLREEMPRVEEWLREHDPSNPPPPADRGG